MVSFGERFEGMQPIGPIGVLKDVAATVAFLTSEEASFITGADLLVNGGRTTVVQEQSHSNTNRTSEITLPQPNRPTVRYRVPRSPTLVRLLLASRPRDLP
ncbi:SDR family oxidoreductase [Halogranum rubrum]|uniref:SDR family oxidoreductase n=1 Tax=Halogranum rubrum TaxID=553466 RepID=UPI002351E7DE|nr:SDR family oxidoreductase [Halogranum salarium]